jgi:hypothetical protein
MVANAQAKTLELGKKIPLHQSFPSHFITPPPLYTYVSTVYGNYHIQVSGLQVFLFSFGKVTKALPP